MYMCASLNVRADARIMLPCRCVAAAVDADVAKNVCDDDDDDGA